MVHKFCVREEKDKKLYPARARRGEISCPSRSPEGAKKYLEQELNHLQVRRNTLE
jgi:hypothetical protein